MPPSIVMYLADDLGVGDVNQHAPDWMLVEDYTLDRRPIPTPNLERLARESVRYTRSYAASSVCGPSRNAIMTGTPVGLSGLRGNDPTYELKGRNTLPYLFREAGYSTHLVGKWGLGGTVLDQGWDTFYGFRTHEEAHCYYPDMIWDGKVQTPIPLNRFKHLSASVCSCGVECESDCQNVGPLFRDRVGSILDRAEQPYFLLWASILPHTGVYDPDNVNKGATFDTCPVASFGEYHTEAFMPGVLRPTESEGVDGRKAMIAYELEADIGMLLDRLDNSTILMLVSDNGPDDKMGPYTVSTSDATSGLRGAKRTMYEGGLRSPTMIRYRGLDPGSTNATVHVGYELGGMLASLAGIDAGSFGVPWSEQKTMELCLDNTESSCQYVYLDGDKKTVVLPGGGGATTYNLAEDPKEENGVPADPDLLKRIKRYPCKKNSCNAAPSPTKSPQSSAKPPVKPPSPSPAEFSPTESPTEFVPMEFSPTESPTELSPTELSPTESPTEFSPAESGSVVVVVVVVLVVVLLLLGVFALYRRRRTQRVEPYSSTRPMRRVDPK